MQSQRAVFGKPASWRAGLAVAAVTAASSVLAHDTWFERHTSATLQRPVLVLGTGNQYPVYDSRNDLQSLAHSGCQAGNVLQRGLVERGPQGPALVLTTGQPLPSDATRVSCWAQLQPFEVDLPDILVDQYFKEAMPPASVRQAWAAQRARGQAWRERYVKHARIEWFSGDPAPTAAASADAANSAASTTAAMALDAWMLQPQRAPRVGEDLEFLVLRDGRPLGQFSVEFRLHSSRLGLWRRTDEQGRVRLRPPAPGRWLLRGIELTPPPAEAADPVWQGLFITLAFEVSPSAAP